MAERRKVSLLIDGRNFLGKIDDVFRDAKKTRPNWRDYDFRRLFNSALANTTLHEQIFYFARINQHPDTMQKSQELILGRRKLKRHIEKQGFTYIHAGNVRGHYQKTPSLKKPHLTFKEKGVDVRVGVDMVYKALTHQAQTVILCSSDSDLQPAVRVVKEAGVECVYLGFEIMPNKGLVATTNKTILFRNSEILASLDANHITFREKI